MGMGYAGYVRVYNCDGAANKILLLATSAGVNTVVEPIVSQAVWGAGWYNAGRPTHYADAGVRYEGNVDIELQGRIDLWSLLREWSIENRVYSKSLEISPDGSKYYNYVATATETLDTKGAWCQSMNFSASEGSFVTSSIGILSIFRTQTDGDNYEDNQYGLVGSSYANFSATLPLNNGGNNSSPIAFWRTTAQLQRWDGDSWELPQTGLETVEWSIDINNNTQPLYTMSGSRLPTAVLQGPIDVSGSVTLYNTDGVFDPIVGNNSDTAYNLTNPYMYAAISRLFVSMDIDATQKFRIYLPAVIISSDDYSLQGQDAIINRTFQLTAMAGTNFTAVDGVEGTTAHVQPPIVFDAVVD